MSPDEGPVAVVGLGNLGLAMAGRLASEGWQVTGIDPSHGRLRLAEKRGVATSDRLDAAACRAICFVVPDETAIRDVLFETGLVRELTADHLLISHSTILPTRVRELASDIEDACAARFLEVPVSGGAERAERGELTLFAAGAADVIDGARPLLETEGEDIVEVGPIGAGAAVKLANQLVMFSAQAALVEGIALAVSYGVEEASVLEALGTATGDTWVGRNWGFFDRVASDYTRSGVPLGSRPWVKDTAEILEAASERGLDLPLAHLVAGSIADVIESHAAAAASAEGMVSA